MTNWIPYVDDIESAIRDRVRVRYATLAVSGTDGHMGAPVEARHVEGLGTFTCKLHHTEGAIIPVLVVGRDNDGNTEWRADMVDSAYRDGHGCGDYWDVEYDITEG